MITKVKRNVFSALAITYAFASSNAIAGDEIFERSNKNNSEIVYELEKKTFSDIDTNKISLEDKESRTKIVPFGEQSFLKIDFEDGEELYWSMENTFSVFETNAPFGMNDKGLIVESEINELANSYSKNISDRKTKIKSNDIPTWILSKYSTVEELKNNIDKIEVVKESNDNSLSYFVSDENESISIEIKNSKIKLV